MDLRRLRDGSIDAAYEGIMLSPEHVAQEEGFRLLAWVGDHFQIPIAWVAVDPVDIPLRQPSVASAGQSQQPGTPDAHRTAPPCRRLHRLFLRPANA